MKRMNLTVFLSLILLPFLLLGCTTEPLEAHEQGEEIVPVRVETVTEGTFTQTLELNGRTRAKQDFPILAPAAVTVSEVYVELGQEVKKGDPLLRFDDSQLQQQLVEARRQVALVEEALSGAEEAQREALAQAAALQAEQQQALERAQAVMDGAQSGAVTMLDLLQASTELMLLQNQTQAFSAVAQTTQPAQLQLQLEQARAQVRQLEQSIEELTIHAPFDGTVTLQQIQSGGMALPNTPFMQLSQLDEIILDIQVGSNHIQQLQTGMKLNVTLEGQQESFSAVLDALSFGQHPQTNTYQAQSFLTAGERTIFPGLLARIEVELETLEQETLVPVQAVFTQEGQTFVYLVQEGYARLQPVTVGERNQTHYRVMEGLEKDDQVITSGKERVTDGRRVYVQNR